MKISEVLERSRALVAQPERWTQGANARDADGKSVLCDSPDAVSFCAFAAIDRTTYNKFTEKYDYEYGLACRFLVRAAIDLGYADEGDNIVKISDHFLDHEMMLGTYDRAIELAKQKELESEPTN